MTHHTHNHSSNVSLPFNPIRECSWLSVRLDSIVFSVCDVPLLSSWDVSDDDVGNGSDAVGRSSSVETEAREIQHISRLSNFSYLHFLRTK